jgi:GNAT superfamily N-acetyltransferase
VRGLPRPNGITWRPLSVDDAEAMSALQQACFEVDGGYRITPSEMAAEFDRYGENVDIDAIGAFTVDGDLQAIGWCQASGSAATEHRYFVFLYLHPGIRGGGIEDALVDWIEQRARHRLEAVGDELPGALYRYEVYASMGPDIELMERHGFAPARYFTESARPLADPIPDLALPAPLEARSWSDAVSADGRAVHNASFADHWGSQPVAIESWESVEREFFLPDASWVVYDADVPVAYLKSARYPHDFADRGRTEAWIEGIGTVRSHRRRGIGSALLTMAMCTFRDDGIQYACLGVDSASPTGANRLYERLGFVPERRWIAFRKELAL